MGVFVYESIRRLALNAFTTDATWEKNHAWELLSGMKTNLSFCLPALCANLIPVSSMVTPCTCVKGSSHSSLSLLDQKERTFVVVNNTTLSPPGRSSVILSKREKSL